MNNKLSQNTQSLQTCVSGITGSERIICPANYYNDGKSEVHSCKNIEVGFVICGHRHHNCIGTFAKMVFKNETVSYRGGIEVNDVINYCKPILKPLTDITEEEYVILDGCHNFSSMRFSDLEKDPTRYPYTIVQKLIEWHYDVFGLIEKGLAISVHDVE